jgi:Spy/CpxP family protein refolding chaperone
MRAIGRMVLTLGAAALMASPALAQRGGGFGGPGMLLTNKGVQKELKLDDAQVQKVESIAQDVRDKMTGLREKLQDVPQDQRREKMQEFMREINSDVKKSLAGVLKPDQLKRFEQIELQNRGAMAFSDPDIQKKLNLTGDQKDKIRGIVEDSNAQRRELFQGFQSDREGTMKKMQELNRETMSKAANVLTSEQKATWKELAGEPYEVKFEPPRGQ